MSVQRSSSCSALCRSVTHPDTVLDMCICDRLRAHGAAEYQRGRADAFEEVWIANEMTGPADALAAIDALKGEQT